MIERFWRGFRQDWDGQWASLGLALVVLLVFSQGWVNPFFGYEAELPPRNGAIIRNIYYPVYLCGLGLLLLGHRQIWAALMRTPLLLLLIGLCALSVLWSVDPATTFRRSFALFMTVLAAYAIAVRFSWSRLTEVIAIAHLVLIAGCFVMVLAFPEKGRMASKFIGAWRGLFSEKNNMGGVMAFAAIICLAAALHVPARRVLWGAVAGAAVFLVLMSTSKTALVTLMIGLGALVFIWLSRRGPVLGIALMWLAVTGLILVGSIFFLLPEQVFALLGKDASLTGRTNIWEGIDYVMQARSWSGYGYGVVWTHEGEWTPLRRITDIAGFRAYHAHSSWYEVWLALGYGGVILLGLVVAKFWGLAFYRSYKGDGGYLALPFIAMYSLVSVTESISLGWNHLRWCLFVILFVKLCLPADKPAAAPVDMRQRLYI